MTMKTIREEPFRGVRLRILQKGDTYVGIVISEGKISDPIEGNDPDELWEQLSECGARKQPEEMTAPQSAADTIQRACIIALKVPASGPRYRLRDEFAPGCSYQPQKARKPALELVQSLHVHALNGVISDQQLLRAFEILTPLLHKAGNKANASRWLNFVLNEEAKGGAWYRSV